MDSRKSELVLNFEGVLDTWNQDWRRLYEYEYVGTPKCGRDSLCADGVCVQSESEPQVETVFMWALSPLTNT
jgi:hypothetical protein